MKREGMQSELIKNVLTRSSEENHRWKAYHLIKIIIEI